MITRVPTIDQSDMDFVYGDSDPDQSPRSPLAEVTAEDETQPPAPRPSSSRGLKRSARVCSVETAEDGDEEDCKVPPSLKENKIDYLTPLNPPFALTKLISDGFKDLWLVTKPPFGGQAFPILIDTQQARIGGGLPIL